MILLEFTVDNIWYRPRQDFESRDYLCREGRFTQHKHWAVQCTHRAGNRTREFGTGSVLARARSCRPQHFDRIVWLHVPCQDLRQSPLEL